MNFGNILKKLRQDNNLTQEELAKKINSSRSNIANYENEKNKPSVEILEKLAKIFNCSTDYLIGKSDYKTDNEVLENYLKNQYEIDIINGLLNTDILFVAGNIDVSYRDKIKKILLNNDSFENRKKELNDMLTSFSGRQKEIMSEIIQTVLDYISSQEKYRKEYHHFMNKLDSTCIPHQYYMCPVYGQISAGQPNWAEECIEGRLPLDTDLMGIVNPEEHFFLRVNGESMNKVIKNGAFALIHKQDLVDDGDIAVVIVNGYDATLKKFTKQGDFVILEPQSNDESFKSQVYDKTTPIKIIGKYVGKMEFN